MQKKKLLGETKELQISSFPRFSMKRKLLGAQASLLACLGQSVLAGNQQARMGGALSEFSCFLRFTLSMEATQGLEFAVTQFVPAEGEAFCSLLGL